MSDEDEIGRWNFEKAIQARRGSAADTAGGTAQQTRVFGDGGNWTQEITGSLATVRNLRVKVDVGTVKVEGGSQQGISYVIRNHSYSGSESKARREFDSYKITAYVRGDTAWIVGDWEGGRPHKFSGDFSISVPREMDEVKVETDGGNVTPPGSRAGWMRRAVVATSASTILAARSMPRPAAAALMWAMWPPTSACTPAAAPSRVNSAKGKIDAESGGGSVVVISGLQGAELETGGGSIQSRSLRGKGNGHHRRRQHRSGRDRRPAEIETGGGSIRLGFCQGSGEGGNRRRQH